MGVDFQLLQFFARCIRIFPWNFMSSSISGFRGQINCFNVVHIDCLLTFAAFYFNFKTTHVLQTLRTTGRYRRDITRYNEMIYAQKT